MKENDNPEPGSAEVRRLEKLWSGRFGDDYVNRNSAAARHRRPFWQGMLCRHPAESILEIGCNIGANLTWIAEMASGREICGIDINANALAILRRDHPELKLIRSNARQLPFPTARFDLVFTMGVLIHQPPDSLARVMEEIVRCSRRYVLCGEYYAEQETEVPYRGQSGALFKRDYGRIYQELFPFLALREQEELTRSQGWDDVTCWLFEKTEHGT